MADTFIPRSYVMKLFVAWTAVPDPPESFLQNKGAKSFMRRNAFAEVVSIINKKETDAEKKLFFDAMIVVLDLFMTNLLPMIPKTTTIAEIFHIRLKTRKSVTPPEEFYHYLNTMQYLIELHTNFELPKQLTPAAIDACNMLFNFLITHKYDVDNSLLGLRPSEALLGRVAEKRPKKTHIADVFPSGPEFVNLESILIGSRRANNIPLLSPTNSPPNSEIFNETEPVEELKALTLKKQVNRLKRIYQMTRAKYQRINVGDLVIIMTKSSSQNDLKLSPETTNNSAFCFGRIAGYGDVPSKGWRHNLYMVFISPDERSTVVVSRERIMCLPASVSNDLGYLDTMERMVFDPTEAFFQHIKEIARQKTLELLRLKGVNDSIISYSKRVTLAEINKIQKNQKLLQELLQECPQPNQVLERKDSKGGETPTIALFNDVEQMALREKELFLRNDFNTETIFLPSVARVIDDLEQCVYICHKFVRSTIKAYTTMCDDAMKQLNVSKQEVVDGSLKESLTDWWLTVINDKVDTFLQERGYDHNAVPFNYIEVPPVSLKAVHNNLALVQQALNNLKVKDGDTPAHQLIRDIKNLILPKIEQFINRVRAVLCSFLSIAPEEFDGAKAKAALKERLPFFEPKMGASIHGMLQDLEYLEEMMFLENNPKKIEGKLELGVVPISGLILGRFYRLENELLTVVDVWKSKPIV